MYYYCSIIKKLNTKKMKPKEQILFELAEEVLNTHGDRVDSMDICEDGDENDKTIKIYHGKGHCFELSKAYTGEYGKNYNYIDPSWEYEFIEPWEGFTVAGIDKAIELIGEYAKH